MLMLTEFFNSGEVDTTCLQSLEKIDFSGTTEATKQLSMQAFGSSNMWS